MPHKCAECRECYGVFDPSDELYLNMREVATEDGYERCDGVNCDCSQYMKTRLYFRCICFDPVVHKWETKKLSHRDVKTVISYVLDKVPIDEIVYTILEYARERRVRHMLFDTIRCINSLMPMTFYEQPTIRTIMLVRVDGYTVECLQPCTHTPVDDGGVMNEAELLSLQVQKLAGATHTDEDGRLCAKLVCCGNIVTAK
jgi:hypothetical protein